MPVHVPAHMLFPALLLGAGLAGLLFVLCLRRQGGRIQERRQIRQMERDRNARALHDTLLQSMQGLILGTQVVADRLPDGSDEKRLMEQLLVQADLALADCRDRVQDQRLAGDLERRLKTALAAVGAEFGPGSGAELTLACSGIPRELDALVADDVLWLGREALVNACRHAGAAHICLHLTYGVAQFQLRVQDDGIGIDPALPRKAGGGLAGMAERSAKLGGHLRIDGDAGTAVTFTLAAATAYREPRHQRRGGAT